MSGWEVGAGCDLPGVTCSSGGGSWWLVVGGLVLLVVLVRGARRDR